MGRIITSCRGVMSCALVLLITGLFANTLSAQTIDHSTGFASNANLTKNGSTVFGPAGAVTVARLTPAAGSQAGSFWHTAKVNIGLFTNTFTFQMTKGTTPIADGITFTIQNAGTTALGGSGGALGYQTIATSVCITFDNYSNGTGTPSLSDLFINGAFPNSATSVAPVDYHTNDVFRVDMAYDGTTLRVTITDTATNATITQSHAIDIATTIGGTTAFVGFTGGTGGLTANQDILTWRFDTITAPSAPTGVTATLGTPPPYWPVNVTWTVSAGAASYTVSRGPSAAGPFSILGTTTTTSFVDNTALPNNTYYYVISATNLAGTSANSAPSAPLTTPPPPPRPPGDKNSHCGCGSVDVNGFTWIGWGAALLGIMVALPRRR